MKKVLLLLSVVFFSISCEKNEEKTPAKEEMICQQLIGKWVTIGPVLAGDYYCVEFQSNFKAVEYKSNHDGSLLSQPQQRNYSVFGIGGSVYHLADNSKGGYLIAEVNFLDNKVSGVLLRGLHKCQKIDQPFALQSSHVMSFSCE